MKYPPSRTSGLRKMQTLQEGEDSRTYRVRAPDAVHEWLGSMTAEQRGELLALARQLGLGHEHPPREWPEGVREHMEALEARFPRGGKATQGELLAPAPADPAEEELRLADGPPVTALSPYAAVIVADLGAGARLTRKPGKSWRLARPDGTSRPVRGDTVFRLLASDVLTVG